MAALEKIRSKAGFLIITIGLAMFAFIIGDFMNSGSSFFRQSQEKIVSIDGESVDIHSFQEHLDDLSEVYKMQTGQTNLSEEMQEGLNQSVFDRIVMEKILSDEYKKIGMSITPEELFEMVQGDNLSPLVQQVSLFVNPTTGVFDKQRLGAFLKQINDENLEQYDGEVQEQLLQAKQYWLFWEKSIFLQRMQEKLNVLLSAALAPNSLCLKDELRGEERSVSFKYVMKGYNSVPDSAITITKSDLKEEYEKTKERYKVEERRVVGYIALPIVPSDEDFQEAAESMDKAKEEFLAGTADEDVVNEYSDVPFNDVFVAESSLEGDLKSFVQNGQKGDIQGPELNGDTYELVRIIKREVRSDSVRVSQVLVQEEDPAVAEKKVDSLLKIASGLDFEQLATQFSKGEKVKADMGWIDESSALRALGEEFRNKTFEGSVGSVFKIKSNYGVHLMKLTGKSKPIAMVKLADIKMKVNPSSKTYSKLYNDVNTLLSKNPSTEELQKMATENGYETSTETLSPNDYAIGVIRGGVRPAIRWVFSNKAGKRSEIFEMGNRFVVLDIISLQSKGYLPMNEVEYSLNFALANQKKGEVICADLASKSLSSLEEYAQAMGGEISEVQSVSFATPHIVGLGVEPALNGALWNASVGQVVGPLKGSRGVYVISPTEINEKATEVSVEDMANKLTRMNAYRLTYQIMDVLKHKSNIKDQRYRFY